MLELSLGSDKNQRLRMGAFLLKEPEDESITGILFPFSADAEWRLMHYHTPLPTRGPDT